MKTNFYRFFPIMAFALIMGACNNDEIGNEATTDDTLTKFISKTFNATMDDNVDTRTSLENGTSVYWNGGDNIAVFTEETVSSADLEQHKFVSNLKEGDKAPNTQFTGMVPEADAYYAFYPFEKVTQYQGKDNGIYFTFPVEQNAVPGGFESGLNVSVAKAENGNNNLFFENLCALVKFKLDGDAAEKIKCVELKNNETISGVLVSSWDSTEEDEIKMSYLESSSSIKLVGDFKRGKDYYFVVVPTSEYALRTGFSLTFTMEGDATRTKTSKGFSKPFLAGTILDLGTITLENETSTETIINPQLIEKIESAADVIFDKDSEGNVPLTPTNKGIIEGITKLSMEWLWGMEDLKGIEYFTNLEYLYCENGDLQSLDVSNLKKLKILVCNNNKIAELNVQDLENLELLYCDFNRLSTLDVSKNLKLKNIFCGYQSDDEENDRTLQLFYAPSFDSLWQKQSTQPRNSNVNGRPVQE